MKTTNATDLKTLSADSLQKLRELGKQYQLLVKNQDALLVKARRIIGFKTPNVTGDQLDAVREHDYHGANVFVEYARIAHLRWEKEEAVEKLKSVITNQKLDKATVLKLLDLYY
jgi:hypothetical protein